MSDDGLKGCNIDTKKMVFVFERCIVYGLC